MNKSGLSERGERCEAPPIEWLMRLALQRPQLISLAAGFTDNETLPALEVVEIVRERLKNACQARSALQYGLTAGLPELRQAAIQRLAQADAAATGTKIKTGSAAETRYSQDQVIITNGSQQLLYLVTEALCDPGDIILVEDPTYFVFLGIVQTHGLRCRGVRMTPEGLDLEQLESVLESLRKSGELPRLKFLYTISYFQNPTGISTPFSTKAAALKLLRRYERAAGHPIHLVEDAAYRELRFAGSDAASTLAVPELNKRVIYTGTFSKPFSTGVRAGYGLLPEPLFTVVNRLKGNHDFGTASLIQQILAGAIASGRYEKHLAVLRRRYEAKAKIMVDALRKHFPASVQWQEPQGGLYIWARLPKPLVSGPNSRLFKAALKQDVLYIPGALCYAEDSRRRIPDTEMRISFGSASDTEIRQGIARLGSVLHGLIDKPAKIRRA
jgi:2-aminoadipate transaminase